MNRHFASGYMAARPGFIALALVSLLGGCAVYGHHGHGDGHHAPDIPKGHMPPPGECRIWYPDRPPGQQPPPGDCRELQYHVPRGAYLIEG